MSSSTRDDDGMPAQAPVDFSEFEDEAAVGDWGLFQRRCSFVSTNPGIELPDALALKRRFCLAYLGARAQALGGVYMRARPSVFTPAFVDRLAVENTEKRFSRYPWLQQLIELLQQLDADQYQPLPQHTNIVAGTRRQHLHIVPTTHSLS